MNPPARSGPRPRAPEPTEGRFGQAQALRAGLPASAFAPEAHETRTFAQKKEKQSEKLIWFAFWSWRCFRQISFVHPEAMARALEASGCGEDDSEERKISALTSYYSGILINPKSVREASYKLREVEKLLFTTLDEAKAYIARKTSALEDLFESVGAYLAVPQDSSGATGWDSIAEMCFDEDCWGTVMGRLKDEEALAGFGQ